MYYVKLLSAHRVATRLREGGSAVLPALDGTLGVRLAGQFTGTDCLPKLERQLSQARQKLGLQLDWA